MKIPENLWIYMLLGLVAIWVIWNIGILLFTRFEREIVVKNKEGYGTRNGRSQLITDDRDRIYSVSSNIFIWHFTSAEVFGKMEVGKRYKIKGYGLRIPMLGMFPNIVHVST
jgi:hypothetical protein